MILDMINWWNSLSMVSQIFYCFAVPATLILLIQTIMMLFGLGENDSVGEGTDDVSDVELADDCLSVHFFRKDLCTVYAKRKLRRIIGHPFRISYNCH